MPHEPVEKYYVGDDPLGLRDHPDAGLTPEVKAKLAPLVPTGPRPVNIFFSASTTCSHQQHMALRCIVRFLNEQKGDNVIVHVLETPSLALRSLYKDLYEEDTSRWEWYVHKVDHCEKVVPVYCTKIFPRVSLEEAVIQIAGFTDILFYFGVFSYLTRENKKRTIADELLVMDIPIVHIDNDGSLGGKHLG